MFEPLRIVVGNGDREFSQSARHSGAIRQAQSCNPRPRLYQQLIRMTVVAALELQNLFAAGCGARHAQRGHGRLRSGVHQANALDRGESLTNPLSQIHFAFRRSSEAGPGCEHSCQRFHDLGMAVAEDQRTPGAYVVDVSSAVHVNNPRAFPARDEDGVTPDRPKGAHG